MPTAKRPVRRTSRSTRTKAELEQELDELRNQQGEHEDFTPETQVLVKEHAAKTREAVKGLSVDNIVQEGAKFGLEAQRTVASLTEQIASKANELKTLQDAIEIETKELERLYNLDTAAASVKALLQEYEEKQTQLEKEQNQARQAWAEEVSRHNKEIQLRDHELRTSRAREQADYDYKIRQERQQQTDEFNQDIRRQQREQQDRFEAVEKDINERKATIAKEEQEIAALKTRVANIDAEIKQKADREVAIATSSLKKDLTTQFTLEKKDLETSLQIKQQEVNALNSATEKMAAQIVQLQSQLDAARAEVKEIAKSAVESASGQTALANIREVIKDNGSSGPRAKG